MTEEEMDMEMNMLVFEQFNKQGFPIRYGDFTCEAERDCLIRIAAAMYYYKRNAEELTVELCIY